MDNLTSNDVLPCPFCGDSNRTRVDTDGVRCGNCGCVGPWYSALQDAVASWNRRPAVEPAAADLIREAFATMQSHAERHTRKSTKAKGDHWPAQHAEFAKRSAEWCVRAQSFLDGASVPPKACTCPEPRVFADGHEWHRTGCPALRVATPPRTLLTEVDMTQAPVWYRSDEASAWAGGYNTALERLAQPPSTSLLVEAARLLEFATYHDGRYNQTTDEQWQAATVDWQNRAAAVSGRKRYSDMWQPLTKGESR